MLNLRSKKTGETFLHFAAAKGKLDIAKLFLEKGLSIYDFDDEGYFPIHSAASENQVILLEWFLSIDKELLHEKNDYGWTPTFVAVQYYAIEAIIFLINQSETVLQDSDDNYCTVLNCILNEEYAPYLVGYDEKNDINGHLELISVLENIAIIFNTDLEIMIKYASKR